LIFKRVPELARFMLIRGQDALEVLKPLTNVTPN
jgi:hypothetical protein